MGIESYRASHQLSDIYRYVIIYKSPSVSSMSIDLSCVGGTVDSVSVLLRSLLSLVGGTSVST